MGINDILDSSGLNIDYNKVMGQLNTAIQSMNSKNKMDIANLHRSVSTHRQTIGNPNSNTFRSSSIEDSSKENKRLLTIQNPERLNTNNNHIKGEWIIEYMGRDLSLEEDNYRWDIHNGNMGIRGYWILEREFTADEWLYVRWGNLPTNAKERRETIHKGRLTDMNVIQRDMINAIRGTIYNRLLK
jgi:hypothetical protein